MFGHMCLDEKLDVIFEIGFMVIISVLGSWPLLCFDIHITTITTSPSAQSHIETIIFYSFFLSW